MKKFFKKSILFLTLLFIVVELFIRLTHFTIDVPQREITNDGIQKYIPNQKGYWTKKSHSWEINKFGWPVAAPAKMENLITLIGDSHIENFMNDAACQPSVYLKKLNPTHNFMQLGRSGATLIEYMEFSNYAKKEFSPLHQIIFIKENDFPESIRNLSVKGDVTQIDLDKNEIVKGKMQKPLLKSIIYNIKTIYYFKDKIKLKTLKKDVDSKKSVIKEISKEKLRYYDNLIRYIKKNYDLSNILFVFHPNTNIQLIEIMKNNEIKYYVFKGNESWSHSKSDNSHWSCEGHSQASLQLSNFLNLNKTNRSILNFH